MFLAGPTYMHATGVTEMSLRLACLVAACFGVSSGAFAGEPSDLLHRVSCSVVRYYVAKYTESAAEQWARSKGATDADIEAAKHCLAQPTQTAKTPEAPPALGTYGG